MNRNGRHNRNSLNTNRRRGRCARRRVTRAHAPIVLFGIVWTLVTPLLVGQEDVGDAAVDERGGTVESNDFSQLQSRLREENLNGRTRLNLLLAAIDRAPDVAAALEVLRSHRDSLDGDHRAEAFAAEGRLLALSGDLQGAAEAYARAYETASASGRQPEEYRLEEAKLRFELGESAEAQELAQAVIAEARDPAVQRSAALLEARAMAEDGRVEAAFERTELLLEAEHRPTLQPDTLLFYLQLSSVLGREEAEERGRALLSELYPDSPEAMLVARDRRVTDFPRPSAFLGIAGEAALGSDADAGADEGDRSRPESPASPPHAASPPDAEVETEPDSGTDESETPSGIQVGSFRNPDNATAMRAEMEQQGFTAEIRNSESSDAQRVIVSIPKDGEAQQTLIELKEKGFEGFFVFDE